MSLKEFGNLYCNIDVLDIQSTSSVITFEINKNRTKEELSEVINEITVKLNSGDDKKDIILTNEEVEILKNSGKIELKVDNLDSYTKYEIKILASLKIGKSKEGISAILNGRKTFITMKRKIEVNVVNEFITEDAIYFDVEVIDPDGAISDGKVTMKMIETGEEKNVKINNSNEYTIKVNENNQIECKGLSKGKKYKLTYTVNNYNEGIDSSTNQKKFEIMTKTYETTTTMGELQFREINKSPTGNNLINIHSTNNWYSECFNTGKGYYKVVDREGEDEVLKLAYNQYYVYDFTDYLNKEGLNYKDLDISFDYKNTQENGVVNFRLVQGKNASTVQTFPTKTNSYKSYNNRVTITIENPYLGFYINSNQSTSEKYVSIKNLMVTEHNEEETTLNYESFKYRQEVKWAIDINLNVANLNKYYIKIYNKKTNDIIKTLEYDYTKETKDFLQSYSDFDKGAYVLDLVVRLEDTKKEYILDSLEIEVGDEEITPISSATDYLNIQPDGNYIVLNNIDLSMTKVDKTDSSKYRFGNSILSFNGNINFNGKVITRKLIQQNELYSTSYDSMQYYLFYQLSENAKIKNLKLNTSISSPNNYPIKENAVLVYKNYGTISNIWVTLKCASCSSVCNCDGNKIQNAKTALIGYTNYGTLENFAIKLETSYYLGTTGALGFVICDGGIMQNGYIYKEKEEYSVSPYKCVSSTTENRIATLVSKAQNGSTIQNVYSTVNINTENIDESVFNDNSTIFYTANIVSELSDSTLRNVYSVGIGNIILKSKVENEDGTFSLGTKGENGANVCIKTNSIVENSYIFTSEKLQINEYNHKLLNSLLINDEWQNNILNSQESKMFRTINSEYTNKKYYPQLNWPEVMEEQDRINCNVVIEENIGMLSTEVIDDGDEEKIVKFVIYNKHALTIKDIQIDGLEVSKDKLQHDDICKCTDSNCVLRKNGGEGYSQIHNNRETAVYAKVRVIEDGECIDRYFLRRIETVESKLNNNNTLFINYTEKEYPIDLKFYYLIENISEFKRMYTKLDNNYKLANDIDLDSNKDGNLDDKELSNLLNKSNTFTGEFDGNNKKIDNLYYPLFRQINNTTIKNLNINYSPVQTHPSLIGLILFANGASNIDNIHVIYNTEKLKLNNTAEKLNELYVGGILANAHTNEMLTISNSSVSSLKISKNNLSDRTISANTVYIGGLVGRYTNNCSITNCFVRDIDIDLSEISITSNNCGIGGITGTFLYGTMNITNCYTTGTIKAEELNNIGGIIGIAPSAFKDLSNCYSTINIDTKGGYASGIAGSFTAKEAIVHNNIYMGNLNCNNLVDDSDNLNIIIGTYPSNKIIYNDNNNDNYGYQEQIVNGIDYSNKRFCLSRSDIKTKIREGFFGNSYNLTEDELESNKSYLPKLLHTETKEYLPNQDTPVEIPKYDGIPKILEITTENPTPDTNREYSIIITLKGKHEFNKGLNKDNITIENIDAYIFDVSDEEGDKTAITVKCKPKYYFDSYILTKLKTSDGNEYSYNAKINLILYDEISDVKEWQDKFKDGYTQGQNYKISGDIDFSLLEDKVKNQLNIGRIIGDQKEDNTYPTIKNYTNTNSLFKSIKTEITNLNFENIEIEETTGNTESSKNIGIIETTAATNIENLNFKNISITAITSKRISSLTLGIIGISNPNGKAQISNITMNDVTCKLSENSDTPNITRPGNYGIVGGLVGWITTRDQNINNITLDNGNITGANYVGGIIGKMTYPSSVCEYSTVEDSNINGYSNVGGIVGYGSVVNSQSINNIINGSYNIGGVAGHLRTYGSKNIRSSGNIITYNGANPTTNSSNVGGICGLADYYTTASIVENILILNLSTNTEQTSKNVGGAFRGWQI